jgi:hypothetical protein
MFVDADVRCERLAAQVAGAMRGVSDRCGSITAEWCAIDVRTNDDFHRRKRRDQPDGFLHFRFSLEIEPLANAPRERYVAAVATLLESLWATGYAAAAACDFEDELPRRGGYQRSGA